MKKSHVPKKTQLAESKASKISVNKLEKRKNKTSSNPFGPPTHVIKGGA